MKLLKILFFVILGAVLVGGWMAWKKLGSAEGVVLTFTEEEIETRLSEKFPLTEVITNQVPIPLPVTVQAPEITFIPGTDRVQARITAEVDTILKKFGTSASFSCGIRYEASDQSLRLVEPVVEEIETSKVPEKYRGALNLLATALAQRYINDQPVYHLKDADLKDHATRFLLKSVEVKNERLVVQLGL
ncbi:DUF1439 domain-containing protein [Akkermansiaceae bacterium]|nr:DUF1439 domain-containing protein [Akkermansiaceae bacterium]